MPFTLCMIHGKYKRPARDSGNHIRLWSEYLVVVHVYTDKRCCSWNPFIVYSYHIMAQKDQLNAECNPSDFKHDVTGKIMARMTDEEAEELDELWTRTTPEVDTGKPGFLARKGFSMVSLDPVTAAYLQAKAAISHHNPSEIIGELVRKELAGASSSLLQDDTF